ncbi:hypothetical protein [Sporofaciens musculi]|nr:hypothetical protein [Sporofaciens musculi]
MPDMVENVTDSVEGIYFLALEWCGIGLVSGVFGKGERDGKFTI